MSYVKAVAGVFLLLAVVGCTGTNMAQQAPTAAPSGIRAAGSAGTTGGSAAAPAALGDVSRTRY